jgi:effector-binding domain-containing protein
MIQSINTSLNNNQLTLLGKLKNNENVLINSFNKKGKDELGYLNNEDSTNLLIANSFYSENSLFVTLNNSDGDTATLSIESLKYQKSIISFDNINSKDEWKKVIDYLKNEYLTLKQEIIKNFLKSNGVETEETKNTDKSIIENTDEIPGLPEYWNAENTSQRIVDFATSFISLYNGSKEEYLTMIKDAIEKGFSEVRDILGDLPDAVNNLVNKTHDLVIDKLNKWAKEQGINFDSNENSMN